MAIGRQGGIAVLVNELVNFNNNIFFAEFYYKLYISPRLALLHAGCVCIFLVYFFKFKLFHKMMIIIK